MALIVEHIECSICDREIDADDQIVCFDHFLGDEHPLWKFSDSVMHKSCFESWPHRDEFLRLHRLSDELLERIPTDIPKDEVHAWYLKEAKRLGLG